MSQLRPRQILGVVVAAILGAFIAGVTGLVLGVDYGGNYFNSCEFYGARGSTLTSSMQFAQSNRRQQSSTPPFAWSRPTREGLQSSPSGMALMLDHRRGKHTVLYAPLDTCLDTCWIQCWLPPSSPSAVASE
jgi:hypothetical protein